MYKTLWEETMREYILKVLDSTEDDASPNTQSILKLRVPHTYIPEQNIVDYSMNQ